MAKEKRNARLKIEKWTGTYIGAREMTRGKMCPLTKLKVEKWTGTYIGPREMTRGKDVSPN